MTTHSEKALDLMDIFLTNKESEEDGVWLGWHPVTDFKVRAFSSKAVQDLRDRLMKPYQTLVRANIPIPDDKNDEIGLKVLSEAVIVDWKGVELNGDDVSFSRDNAYAVLKKLPRLGGALLSASADSANFRDQAREEDAGN